MNRKQWRTLSECLNEWFNSFVVVAYIGFTLYDISKSFREALNRWWESIKPKPKVMLSFRLQQELRDIINNA